MAKQDITQVSEATQFRSGDEAVMSGRMGGIASGEARRRKRAFRDELDALLPLIDIGKDGQPVKNQITGEDMTIQQTITMQWLFKARKGDMKAIKLILDTLGELVIKEEHKHDVDLHQPVFIVPDQETKDALEKLDNED